MELIHGDNFLKGLDQITTVGKYLPNVGEDTNWLNQPVMKGTTTLSNANAFPEAFAARLGGAGDYISNMIKHGVDPNEIEEFIRQYQFNNSLPEIKQTLSNIIPKGVSMGTVLPPFLSDIMQAGVNQKNQGMGGA